jgi:hypothetical protein
MLIGAMFDRIDCPECAASFCEDCDRQDQQEGKWYFDHTHTYIFYMHYVKKYHPIAW